MPAPTVELVTMAIAPTTDPGAPGPSSLGAALRGRGLGRGADQMRGMGPGGNESRSWWPTRGHVAAAAGLPGGLHARCRLSPGEPSGGPAGRAGIATAAAVKW